MLSIRLIRNLAKFGIKSQYFITSSNTPNIIRSLSFFNKSTTLCNNSLWNIENVRYYAKSKDKRKEKGKAKVEINENQLAEVVNIESIRNQMQKAIDQLKTDFTKQLSLRSTVGSIESLPIEFEGTERTLQEVAQVVRKNPKLIVINMNVFPQAIPDILKAINKSGMNLNPQQDGTTLYIPIPKVTTEHREALAKNAKSLFVKCKDLIRDVQNKSLKSLKKKSKVSEDLIRSCEQQIIAIADSYIVDGEKILESKQRELIGKD